MRNASSFPNFRTARPPSKAPGGKLMVLFGLVFMLPGLAMIYFLGVRPLLQVQRARHWPPVPATVLSSEVRAHRGSDSTTYSIHIVYRYTWEGRDFTSDRYDFTSGSSSGRESKARVVRAHPPGHRFEVFVNPARPDESVIHRDFQWMYLGMAGFGAVFVFAGLAIAIGGLRAARPGSRSDTRSYLPPRPKNDPGSSLLLKPDQSPWAKVAGLLIFTLFWNGIVSVFLFQAWKSWQQNSADYFLMVFLVPFVLIGLGALLGFLYALLATFNPRPLLLISPALPRPGDPFTLDWEFHGSTARLHRFSMILEGLERIEYQTGSGKQRTTHTRESLFYQHPLLETDSPDRLQENTLSHEIPADLPHSFHAPNNKLIWRIRVHGPIRFWPDLKQAFPITVLPKASGS